MTSNTTTELTPAILAQIVESAFQTLMSLPAEQCDEPWHASSGRTVSAVSLSGEVNCTILFECGPDQACRFAGRMLHMDPPADVDDEVRDVLCELANIIGGNMKGLLAPGTRLSTPWVVDSGDYDRLVCQSPVRERLSFACAEGVFWVALLSADR